ncbi:MAG: sulfotransferase domain-containing protein [Rhodobiaceae bacterium]|nr:sulfotransferase domain-containing protein [Rhodobiaceae bacterium]
MGNIIWLASYPKSGNTWMRSFLHNLLKNSRAPVDINELDHFCIGESSAQHYQKYLSSSPDEVDHEVLAKLRPRVQRDFTTYFPDSVFAKTHNFLGEWHGVPLHNMDVTTGAIYVLRNPLDIVLSMTHHYGEGLDGAIARLANAGALTAAGADHVPEFHSSWSRHVESWTARPNPQLLVVRYEDLTAKPRKFFKQVTNFLGLKPSKERLERSIRNSSFKALKRQEEKSGFKEKSEFATSFFREGKTEQWRTQLTDAQIQQIVDAHREQMERFGYVPEGY